MTTATNHDTSASRPAQRKPANALLAMARGVIARESQRVRQSATKTGKRGARGQQLRLRLAPAAAMQLRELPARVRAEIVALTVNATLAGVPVEQLVGYRQELKNLGLLLNQSLRVSRGQSVNVEAVKSAAEVIQKLIQR